MPLDSVATAMRIIDGQPCHDGMAWWAARCVHSSTLWRCVVLQRRDDAGCSFTDARDMWGEASAPTFMVRSLDYMRSKQKVNSGEAIYQLVGVDLFSFQHKQTHIAKHVTLPAPAPQRHVSSPETYLPPLLVVNIMLPLYPVSQHRAAPAPPAPRRPGQSNRTAA